VDCSFSEVHAIRRPVRRDDDLTQGEPAGYKDYYDADDPNRHLAAYLHEE